MVRNGEKVTTLLQEQKIRARRSKLSLKLRLAVITWPVALAILSLANYSNSEGPTSTFDLSTYSTQQEQRSDFIGEGPSRRAREVLRAGSNGSSPSDWVEGVNCTIAGITQFPRDLFSEEQRQQGFLAIHFLASVYVFYSLALICDDYFVPSIECICQELRVPSDVAGATFMAVATSSPELFTNCIGTFITEGDIGVGTIVGSAVFNLLAVTACCGLSAKTALPLEWYPLSRDCLFYSISVILLIVVLNNRQVFWYEALILVIAYALYILVMYMNARLKHSTEGFVAKLQHKFFPSSSKGSKGFRTGTPRNMSRRTSFVSSLSVDQTTTPLLGEHGMFGGGGAGAGKGVAEYNHNMEEEEDISAETMDKLLISKALHELQNTATEEKDSWGVLRLPRDPSLWTLLQWLISWPARVILTLSVPDCREKGQRKYYLVTFVMCIVWIALLSYVVSWMMTIIGHTLRIPDSVMGLTFIAAGTSIPEAVSSIIVARQGLGTMSISNSIGSNTFDILICLGLPWLIKGLMLTFNQSLSPDEKFIQINSGGLEYSAMILMGSLIALYILLAYNKFYLDKKVGLVALGIYVGFLVFASLFEMNVFFTVNLPTCPVYE